MMSKTPPLRKSLRYLFAFSCHQCYGPRAVLNTLIERNIIRCCYIQSKEKSDGIYNYRGFFTLKFPKAEEELDMYGATLKPTALHLFTLRAILKKNPYGKLEVLRGPMFDLKNKTLLKRYHRSKNAKDLLEDIDEIEGEYRVNKKIQSCKDVTEDLLKVFST